MFPSPSILLVLAASLASAAPLPGLLGGDGLLSSGDGTLGVLGGNGGLLSGGARRPDAYYGNYASYGYPSHGASGGGLLPGAGLLADVSSGEGQPVGLIGKRGGLLGGLGGGLLSGGPGATGGLLAGGPAYAGVLGGPTGGPVGGILGGGSTGLLNNIAPRSPGLLNGGGGRLSSLDGSHDLLSNGNGLLGIGEPQGLANTGLLAGGSKYHGYAYQWTAPEGWTMPGWYEFGFYHPESGIWTYDPPSVLEFLLGRGYTPISSSSYAPQPLFPSTWDHPVRAIDLTRAGQYGYFGQDASFITVEEKVSNLLGSCGYYRPQGVYY